MSVTKVIRGRSVMASAIYAAYGDEAAMRDGNVRAAALSWVSARGASSVLGFALGVRKDTRAHDRKIESVNIIQSWHPDELDINNPADVEKAHAAGLLLAEALAPGCDVLVATHTDAKGGHVHNHIVIANHDVKTGHAITYKRAGFHPAVKAENDKLMRDMGLEVLTPSPDRSPRPSPGVPAADWKEDIKEAVARLMSDPRVLGANDVETALDEMEACALAHGLSFGRRGMSGKRRSSNASTFALVDKNGDVRKVKSGEKEVDAKVRGSSLGSDYTMKGLRQTLQTWMTRYRAEQQAEVEAAILEAEFKERLEAIDDGIVGEGLGGTQASDNTTTFVARDGAEESARSGTDHQAARGAGGDAPIDVGRGGEEATELGDIDAAGVANADARVRDALARLGQRRREGDQRRRAASAAAKADERQRKARERADRDRRRQAIADSLVEGLDWGEYGGVELGD